MIEIKIAEQPEEIEAVRHLLLTYAEIRNYDEALGDYKSEIVNLPAKYARPDGCLLFALSHSTPIGMLAFRKFNESICEMKRMFVLPEHRTKGCATLLVKRLLTQARVQGYQKMYLDTHPWMTDAQSIYYSFGFIEIEAYHHNPTPGIKYFELSL